MNVFENPFSMGYITAAFAVGSGHTPVINSYLRDDVASADVNGALGATQRANRRNTLLLINNTPTYENVPDLKVAITRGGGYAFEYWIPYVSSVVGEGIGLQLAFSGTANGIGYSIQAYSDAATLEPLVYASDFGTGIAPFAAGPGLSFAVAQIKGSCFVLTEGDLNLQFRAKTGAPEQVAIGAAVGQVWAT